MGSQRVGHDWATKTSWESKFFKAEEVKGWSLLNTREKEGLSTSGPSSSYEEGQEGEKLGLKIFSMLGPLETQATGWTKRKFSVKILFALLEAWKGRPDGRLIKAWLFSKNGGNYLGEKNLLYYLYHSLFCLYSTSGTTILTFGQFRKLDFFLSFHSLFHSVTSPVYFISKIAWIHFHLSILTASM